MAPENGQGPRLPPIELVLPREVTSWNIGRVSHYLPGKRLHEAVACAIIEETYSLGHILDQRLDAVPASAFTLPVKVRFIAQTQALKAYMVPAAALLMTGDIKTRQGIPTFIDLEEPRMFRQEETLMHRVLQEEAGSDERYQELMAIHEAENIFDQNFMLSGLEGRSPDQFVDFIADYYIRCFDDSPPNTKKSMQEGLNSGRERFHNFCSKARQAIRWIL